MRFCSIARLLAVSALILTVAAQSPPPEREEALRAAVKTFSDAFLEEKYRKAYALVAEDSQEYFMEMGKLKFSGYTIDKIEWSDNFTKAKVTNQVDTEFHLPGNVIPVKRPWEQTWRLENGEWLWYYVQPTQVQTPFGMVTVDPNAKKKKINVKEEYEKAPRPDDLNRGVELITKEVKFSRSKAGEGFIEVKNGLSGHVSLELVAPRTPGLKVEKRTIPAAPNETVKFRLVWDPPADLGERPPVNAEIASSPIGGSHPLTIVFEN